MSIVLPVHNEAGNLAPLIAEITRAFGDMRYEIVTVDDASTDASLRELRDLAGTVPPLHVVSLTARSGQSAAVLAGVDAASGDWIITMDADGQNDPTDGRRLCDALRSSPGVTAVVGYRASRADGWWKRVQSRVANAGRNVITGDRVRDTGCSLRVMRRSALLRVPRFDGMHRFLPTLLRVVGEQVEEIEVSHRPRVHGVSKYGMWGRLGVGLRDAIGVRWLVKHGLTARTGLGTGGAPEVYK